MGKTCAVPICAAPHPSENGWFPRNFDGYEKQRRDSWLNFRIDQVRADGNDKFALFLAGDIFGHPDCRLASRLRAVRRDELSKTAAG